jgi:hypothetical protein
MSDLQTRAWLDQLDARVAEMVSRYGQYIAYISGGRRGVGEVLAFESWSHRVAVERLPNPGKVLFLANRHYRRPDARSVPAYQLTYDDLGGRFPWDDGYVNVPQVQPRPGTWRA